MVQYARTCLRLHAASDATRSGVWQLGRADASITDLAEKFHMTPHGHEEACRCLEQALVTTEKAWARAERVNSACADWRKRRHGSRYRQLWDARFDELDKVVE